MLQSIKQMYKKSFFLILLVLSINESFGQACYSTWNPIIQYAQDSTSSLGTPYQVSKDGHNYTVRFANVNSEPKSNSCCEWSNWIDEGVCFVKAVSSASYTPKVKVNTLMPAIFHTTTSVIGITSVLGLPKGINAIYIDNQITISGTPTESGTFKYRIRLDGSDEIASGLIIVNDDIKNNNDTTASKRILAACAPAYNSSLWYRTGGASGCAGGCCYATNNVVSQGGRNYTAAGFCVGPGRNPSTYKTPTYTDWTDGGACTSCSTPSISGAGSVCIGSTLTLTGAVSGGTWSSNNAGIASINSSSGVVSGVSAGSVTITYTVSGGCSTTATVTVPANRTVGAASSTPTLCINSALTNITHATTGATGIGAATGLPSGVSAAWAGNVITISGTPTASGTFSYSIPLTGGCGGAVNATGTITVTAANTAGAASSTPTLCINSALTNITIATTGATGIASSGVSGGNSLPAGVSATWSGNVITISGTPTASGTFNYSILLTGGCGTVNATGTITVNANTAGVASSTPTLCINTALTNITRTTTGATGISNSGVAGANGLPAGVSAAWAGNVITISGTPTASGTFNYSIPLTGGCGTVNATGTITVTANNTAGAASSTPTLCINTALTNITHATTVATGIANSGVAGANGLPAGVSATWAGNVITISGTPTAAGTFNYSIPLTGGCGTVNATGTITVTAANTAGAASSTPTLCNNTALTNITHATTGATGIANSGVSGGNGLPAGVSATWAGNVITISGTPTASGTFNYSILLTGGCGTVNATGTITVNANTAGAASSTPTLCINTALTNITRTTTVATGISNSGVSGANGLPAGVSAAWAGNVITISGTPTAAGTFNYSIPLTGGCGTVNATGTITVTAANTAGAASSTPTLCINTALTNITHATTGATGISNSGVSGGNGLPTGVSAAWAGNVITISGTPSASGTFSYSIPLTGGCGTVSATGTITVNPSLVQGAIAADQSIVPNAIPATFTSTTAASGGGTPTYQWQISTDNASWANIGGATAATYTAPSALTNDTWYRRAAISSSCGTLYTTSVKVTVVVSVCTGSAPPTMNSGSVASGGGGGAPSYQWQSSTDGITYANIASATSVNYSPGSVSQDTWYRRAAIINGCTGYSNVLKATASLSAPGGVTSGLLVWLKADAGTSNIGTQWQDQSGNGYHYTTVSGPTLVAGDTSSNFNPYVQILSGGFDAPVGAALGNDYTIFMVAKKLASDDNGRIFDGHTGNFSWGYAGQSAGSTSKRLQTFTSSSGHANGIRVDINQGANTATEGSDAQVYELIIYNSVLSNTQIDIIESYLMSKYRLGSEQTYLSSVGNSVFDVSSYSNDIIGVGKECYYHQKQSKAQDDSCKIFISTLAATNADNAGTITNSPSYFMIGHDDAKLKETTAANLDIPPANTNGHTILSRIAREWKVTNTNFDNDVTIKFIIENQSAVTNLSHLCLMVDDDGDFTSGCTVYGQGESGVTFSFGSIDVLIPAAIIPKGTTKFIALGSKNAASKFTITALPIVLTVFKAVKVIDGNLVSWSTSSEINNSHFVLQKSFDGEHWHVLEEIDGAGNSTTVLNYHFIDREHCPSICYYRLKQVDYDGKFETSKIISIESESLAEAGLRIYPDPVGNNPTVEYYADSEFEFELEIYSIDGSIISETTLSAVKGLNSFEINTSNYSSGVYFMLIKDMSGIMLNNIKFIK
jgi:hypothetical protein